MNWNWRTFWNSQRAAAIEDEKGAAHWGEEIELPPPTAEEAETRLFAEPLIRGALEHRDAIDEKIKSHAKNWDFHRIAAVDRNIMRLAIYEMLHREDIPPVVSINEAVDIAKKFSTQDSGKFVNGILDKIRGEILRPARNCEMKFADLHLHTQFSDGTFTPEELVGARRRSSAWRHRADRPRHGRRLRAHGGGVRGGEDGIHSRHGTHRRTRRHGSPHLSAIFSTRKTRNCWRKSPSSKSVRQNRIHEMVAAHEQARRAAQGRIGFRAGQLQIARPPARRARAGEGQTRSAIWTRRLSGF